MLRRVKVTRAAKRIHRGRSADKFKFKEETRESAKERHPASAKPTLIVFPKRPASDSFMAAASFQETTRY